MKYLKLLLLMILLLCLTSCKTAEVPPQVVTITEHARVTHPALPEYATKPDVLWKSITKNDFNDPIYGKYLKEFLQGREIIYLNLPDASAMATYLGEAEVDVFALINLINYYIGIINIMTDDNQPLHPVDGFTFLHED